MIVLLYIIWTLQIIGLIIWSIVAKSIDVADGDDVYPSFKQALLLLFIPLSCVYLLLKYLYDRDKLKKVE